VVYIDGKVVAVVEVMAELKGSLYYGEVLFFGGGPVYFAASKGSSGIRDWVFLIVLASITDMLISPCQSFCRSHIYPKL
jgi:hypothetical protein